MQGWGLLGVYTVIWKTLACLKVNMTLITCITKPKRLEKSWNIPHHHIPHSFLKGQQLFYRTVAICLFLWSLFSLIWIEWGCEVCEHKLLDCLANLRTCVTTLKVNGQSQRQRKCVHQWFFEILKNIFKGKLSCLCFYCCFFYYLNITAK